MRYTRTLIPTLKEDPAEAEVISHKLMLRAGLIRKLASGIYTWLPMGLRAVRKVEKIVREEMNAAGAQELLMPGVQPAELWKASGRWEHYGKELLRFTDRHGHDYCLGPTHEEVITDLVRREVRSYRELPLNLYQIQTKFRDEIRPRFGVMRAREFIMKDAYSFDADEQGAEKSYEAMREAYQRMFSRMGLKFKMVEADTGAIGGSSSHEFMVLAETGEDRLVSCKACEYAANVEKAEVPRPEGSPAEPTQELTQLPTPGVHTVEEVAQFVGVTPQEVAKTLIYLADGKPVAAMVRGDRELNEVKLKNLLGAATLEMAPASVIEELTGAPVGFSGPVGLNIPVYADYELALCPALVVGANKAETHLTGFNLHRDAPGATLADLRVVAPGDPCPRCGGELEFARGIEVGHIFRLGTKYSEAMGATFLDAEGNQRPVVMGCYGIGITRIVAAAIEQGHDDAGIIFPMPIAPVSAAVLPMEPKGEIMETAERIYRELWDNQVDTLLDDRDVRAGVKFKDCDLLGVPLRIVVGRKGLAQGKVELKRRQEKEPTMVEVEEVVRRVVDIFKAEGGQFIG